jgi:hypothetical protein
MVKTNRIDTFFPGCALAPFPFFLSSKTRPEGNTVRDDGA